MFLKLCILSLCFVVLPFFGEAFRIGLIQRKGDEIAEELFRKVLKKRLEAGRSFVAFQTVTEVVTEEDAWYYHRAVCRLLEQEAEVIVAPTRDVTFPILASYSNEYEFPFLSPDLPEAPEDPTAPDLIAKYGFGIRPSTTRATLDLIRYFGWQNLVYIYDDDFGPEKVQIMFRIGYSILKFHLVGFLKATSAENTIQYLQQLSHSKTHKNFDVILDVEPHLAAEILLRFVHDTGIRKDSYRFLLIRPTLEDFWTMHDAEFRVVNVTGFLTVKPDFKRFDKVGEEWRKLYQFEGPYPNSSLKLDHYYYHDAAVVLAEAMKRVPYITDIRYRNQAKKKFPGCFQVSPHKDNYFSHSQHINLLKRTNVEDGLTGHIEFDRWNETQSKRVNFELTIVQSTPTGYQKFGTWSVKSHGLQINRKPVDKQPGALPQVDNKLRVTSILNPPYMMLKKGENASHLQGNDRFEGFCKDMMDSICEHLHMECELKLVEDESFGRYDRKKGRWTGMVGDLIQGKADMAIADMIISPQRQQVVEFTDPFEMVSISLLMKNPDAIDATSSAFFVFSAFSLNIWICILVAFVGFCALLHGITKYSGAPDSIESASGIWGRKNRLIANIWFAVGSSLMQGTGVYPRSISSRILSVGWWLLTSFMTCFLIASLTTQLQLRGTQTDSSPSLMQLKSLSMESVILESLENGWPKIGMRYRGSTDRFVKESTLPLFKQYATFVENNPSVFVSDVEVGAQRVRDSGGHFALLVESTKSDYEIRQKPCDLVAIHDPYVYGAHGIATPLKSPLRFKVNEALSEIRERGLLGHLYRKWWIDASQCKEGMIEDSPHGTLHSFSGLFYILIIGCLVLAVIFAIQYIRKIQHKEDRLQQLTFDDRTLEHHLPDPPPELLAQPPPVLNVPEIEKRDFCDSESFNDFFERMKVGR